MARPKSRPKMQNRIPTRSNRWPSMPRNCTVDRSGTLRLASPPTSPSGWAKAAAAPTVRPANVAARFLVNRQPVDAALAIQVRMGILQNRNFYGLERVNASPSGKTEFSDAHCLLRREERIAGIPNTLPHQDKNRSAEAWPRRIYQSCTARSWIRHTPSQSRTTQNGVL